MQSVIDTGHVSVSPMSATPLIRMDRRVLTVFVVTVRSVSLPPGKR